MPGIRLNLKSSLRVLGLIGSPDGIVCNCQLKNNFVNLLKTSGLTKVHFDIEEKI